MNLLQLEGRVDDRDQLISELREEIADLKDELLAARMDVEREKRQSGRAVGNLRRQLTPLYQALQAVFGEIEVIGGDEATAPAADSRTSAVWLNWKEKMGGSCAKVIDALLLHGEMNTQQVAIAVGLHRTTIPALIYKLNQAGLINKNGGKFSLKKL